MKTLNTPEQQAENRKKAAIYKDRRLELGLTQKQLADKAGVYKETITCMERGINFPRLSTRQKIRRVLDMPEDCFYTVAERNMVLAELIEREVIEWEIRCNMRTLKRIGAIMFLEDLRQDCLVVAMRAIDRFRPDRGASVETFVKKNVRPFIKQWILSFRLHGMVIDFRSIPQVTVYSLDALAEERFQLEG